MRQAPLAELNTTGKNFLVDRLAFTAACGCKFRVSPEIYGDALDLSGEFQSVLIRLPIPRDTFYRVTEWSPPGTPLAIVSIELTHDIYQLDAGKRILVKVETKEKDERGNPITVERPILRPHVWATGPLAD